MATTVRSSMSLPRFQSPFYPSKSVTVGCCCAPAWQAHTFSSYRLLPQMRPFSITPPFNPGRPAIAFVRHRHSFIGAPVIASSISNAWCHETWLQLQFGRSPRHYQMSVRCVIAAVNFPILAKLQILLQKRLPIYLSLGHPVWLAPPAVAAMVFATFGLGPCIRFVRRIIFRREDNLWDDSRTRYIMTSYVRPVILWISVLVICRGFDPIVLASETSQAIKERFVNFVRSLSTVLAFAFCTASLTQQIQKFMVERQDDAGESRNLGVQFVGNTVYTLVWVAAVCLFMELLGFSTQKWITAGGFGTVLLTLAGRELVTNFLSSIMIHATRPFMVNEWIQTKIEGQEISGTVEHVGWWEPTIIRGDDREAVHIPNHKFSVGVVRNLSQRTHWRIKSFFGISHYDAGKIGDIVGTMRKVIAKHPQLEQRHLHRRVVLEHVSSENQALMIMVSCFVKTSHFEEYLRVKEEVLLELLNVISLHGARLATPIRSVQRVYDDSDTRSSHYRDEPANDTHRRQPFFLVETQKKGRQQTGGEESVSGGVAGGADASQPSVLSVNVNQPKAEASTDPRRDSSSKSVISSVDGDSDEERRLGSSVEVGEGDQGVGSTQPQRSTVISADVMRDNREQAFNTMEGYVHPQVANRSQGPELHVTAASSVTTPVSSTENPTVVSHGEGGSTGPGSTAPKVALEGLDSMGLNSRDITLLGAAFEKPPASIVEGHGDSDPFVAASQPRNERFLLDERFVRPISGGASPDPWTSDSDSSSVVPQDCPSPVAFETVPTARITTDSDNSVVVNEEMGVSGLRPSDLSLNGNLTTVASHDENGDRVSSSSVGGAVQKQSSTPARSQSMEDNLVLEVALGGPKRVLDLPLDADPLSQMNPGNGKESKEDLPKQATNNVGSSESTLAISGS